MNIRWLLSIGGVAVFMAVLTIPALTRTLERPQESGGDYTQYHEPDQKALFRIYMAANGEVLLDSPAAVWEYFTLFHAPPRSTGATPGRPAPLTPECAQLFTLQRNEITARKLLDQARADFAADLKAAGTWPRTEIMRVSANVSLGTYNAAKGAFPLMGVGGQWFGQAGGTPYAPQRGQSISTYYGAPDTKWCRVRLPPGTIDEGGAKPPLPTSFQIEVEGPALTALPMESGAAEAYLEGQTGRGRNARTIRVDALLEVGPATLNPDRRPGPLSVPARIIAARAMDPVSGRVIHEFIPVKGQAAGRPVATTAAPPQPAGARRHPRNAPRLRPGPRHPLPVPVRQPLLNAAPPRRRRKAPRGTTPGIPSLTMSRSSSS